MPSIEYLRAKALAHRPTFRYPICLDDDKRNAIDVAQAALVELHVERQKLTALPAEQRQAKSLASKDPLTALDAKITVAEKALVEAERAASDEVVILTFKRLSPDEHNAIKLAHMRPDLILKPEYYPALAEAAYTGTGAADGQDVGLSWQQAYGLLNTADEDNVFIGVHNLHSAAAIIPFSQASSGQPDTSSTPA